MSVAVVGFDIGYQNCYVSVARGGGIETVTNEYSDRSTPTCVSFGNASRSIGAAAKQQQVTNVKNTVYGFTRFLGRVFDDPIVQEEIKMLPYQVVQLPNNQIGVKVNYLDEEHTFSPEQLVAMQLTKLKEIAESNLKTKVVDIVLNIPSTATDVERRALLDAAQIAGLNCVRIINDTTAIGVAYGLYNRDFPPQDNPPRNVAFVDFGASNLQVSIVAFNDGKMKVLSTVVDRNLGGRDFDRALVLHMAEEFQQKYKINALSSPKATVRLAQECERLKKIMSASTIEVPLNIECFLEDKDVHSTMKRADYEVLIEPLLRRVETVLRQVLADAQLKADDVHIVEIVGGSSRTPAVKAIIQEVFGKEPRTTLNADEAVSRGCSLQCAILSPAFRVRDFSITDVVPHSISLTFADPQKSDQTETMEVFPRGHSFPFSRQITFYRKEPFVLNAVYTHPDLVPHRSKEIGVFQVQNVEPTAEGEASKIKVKVRVNVHGIFSVSQASLVELVKKVIPDEPAPATAQQPPATNGEPVVNSTPVAEQMEVDPNAVKQPEAAAPNGNADGAADPQPGSETQPAAEPQQPKTKMVQKLTDLPIQAQIYFANDKQTVMEYVEKESKFVMQDKLEKERQAAKNFVEEYVYEMRDKMAGKYELYAAENERDDFCMELSNTEDWLYGEGENLNKQVYVERLQKLKQVGDKFRIRCDEAERRPKAVDEFSQLCVSLRKILDGYEGGDETYNHIDKVDMTRLSVELEEKQKWFHHEMHLQNAKHPFEDPLLTVDRIIVQKQALENTAKSILNKPKPKVEPPPPVETKAEEKMEKDGVQDGDSVPPVATAPADDMDID